MILLCPVSLPTPRASTSQAADDATKAGATAQVKERRTFLRVAEAGLIAAHRPVTLLLPAATIILVLREASRWLELLVDLHDDYLPRFTGRSHRGFCDTPCHLLCRCIPLCWWTCTTATCPSLPARNKCVFFVAVCEWFKRDHQMHSGWRRRSTSTTTTLLHRWAVGGTPGGGFAKVLTPFH